jgi:hypothetical protein
MKTTSILLALVVASAGLGRAAEPAKAPKIQFEKTVYDFGATSQVSTVTGVFKYKNIGTAVLKIEPPKPGCGCTLAELKPDTLQPGETGELAFTLHLGQVKALFDKPIAVKSNDPELCQTCHSIINPVGFTFEHFDTVGRWRDQDHGLPIDDDGMIDGVTLDGASALVDYLADSDEVERCVSSQFLTYAVAGTAAGEDACLTRDVDAAVAASSGSLRDLMVALATHPRFLGLPAEPTEEN